MRHPAEPHLQAYVDGELAAGEEVWLGRHVQTCAQCAAALNELRVDATSFSMAVRAIDDTEPPAWRRVADRAGTGQRRATSWIGPLRWAAVILLSVTAVGAAALVGRNLLRDRAADSPESAAVQTVAEPDRVAGVFLAPVAGRAIVQLNGAAAGSYVRVVSAERSDVSVQVTSRAAVPRFRVDDRASAVTVDLGAQDGSVTIEVPATLQSGEVRVGDRLVVRVTNGEIDPPEAAESPGLAIGSRR